jgi:tRNA(Arg) A34 adenosine deaminase TadA
MANRFMQRAIELALENVRSGRGGPFGAVVVRDGNILAEGANSVVSLNDPTAHAEVVAIREACRRLGSYQLAGCELYTTCEPCPMCLGAIYWSRPDRVYFAATRQDAAESGFDDDLIYRETALPPAGRRIPMESLMREAALVAFREWDRLPVKIRY